jgi:Bacterial pre-peptidase C-terminal domain
MTRVFTSVGHRLFLAVCVWSLGVLAQARADLPSPYLQTVFPAGGQAGNSVTVAVDGTALEGLRDIHSTIPRLTAKKTDANRFVLNIPAGTPPGVYDLRTVGLHGMSSPRAFVVGNRAEYQEKEPNDTFESAQDVPLDVVINGRIEKPGDVDCYKFKARAGQRVVLECLAERIDSRLRAVLEVFDAEGKRLAGNRGYAGIDPLVDFLAPADGTYFVKVFDLTYLGGSTHFYRLDIDAKPRVEFALPSVVTRGKATRVKLFGRNLLPPGPVGEPIPGRGRVNSLALDCVEVEITPPAADHHERIPLPLRPAQMTVDAFPYWYPGGHAPVLISATDVPVLSSAADNHVPAHAQEIVVPCEVSGQLTHGDERHWFAVTARRGEVLWLEAFGARIGSPVDLEVTVLDPGGRKELVKLADSQENLGGYRFSTAHPDPAGRWAAPADGRYLLLVRNLIGGLNSDPRRIYRLSIRREEPDFHLAVISRRTDQPAGLNLASGGRELVDVLAIRRRGLSGPIRIAAENLPPGIQCPDSWIGPGQDHGVLVLSAVRECPSFAGGLNLVGHADVGGMEITRSVRGGAMIWPGQPTPSGRLTQEIPLATAPEVSMLLTASPAEGVVDQEGVLDVAVDVEQRFEGLTGPVNLSGVGLPRLAGNAIATLPTGKKKATLSFFFPASLPPGPYTFAVQAETTLPAVTGVKGGSAGKVGVTLVSNPITVMVRPARIILEIDPQTPRKIGRGKIIQLRFTAERKHGFIGKIHTELVAPGGVVGLRGRGVTLVGQSDSGTLQVIATEDAPLGRQQFLRLEAVGTVEDQPVYRASRFVELEITE